MPALLHACSVCTTPARVQGADCLLLCVEHASQAVYLAAGQASSGGAALSHLQHGLAAQYTFADFLSSPGADDLHGCLLWTLSQTLQSPMSSIAGAEEAKLKSRPLCTTRQQLLPSHESIILGSQGLWAVLDKDDAALHTHFHLKVAPPDDAGLPCWSTNWHTCAGLGI